ncbi:MAG: glycosyltransferase [Clostridia bacterium]|nr:glycosyltransferase [Clostridia bacterium]
MTPCLSVIVPVYNVEKYLEQCLDSLVGQTLKDIEIILVNDGSTDHSEEICRRYADRDSRVRLYTKPNGGLSDARNYGLERATADVVGFVDSDDYVDPDMYEQLLRTKAETSAQIAIGCIRRVTDDGMVYITRTMPGDCVFNRHDAMEELLYSRRISNSVCNKVIDKALFDGIPFPKGRLYEDEFVTYRLFDRSDTIAVNSKVFYYYRKNPNSITNVKFTERELDRVKASLIKLDFVREHYPDLQRLVEHSLVYDCMRAMTKMERYDHRYDELLLGNMKKYRRSYLKGNHSLSAKLFVTFAPRFPGMTVRGYQMAKSLTHGRVR